MEWNAIIEEEISMEERRGKSSDIEECKLLKISTKWSVITEEVRQTASQLGFFFFLYCEIKTLINFQVEASWASPFLSVLKMCFHTSLIHSSQRGRGHTSRAILGNLAWPETWRWRVDGGRTLLLFTAHLALLHPDTHTIYEDNRRAGCALLEHSLMDGCEARGRQADEDDEWG